EDVGACLPSGCKLQGACRGGSSAEGGQGCQGCQGYSGEEGHQGHQVHQACQGNDRQEGCQEGEPVATAAQDDIGAPVATRPDPQGSRRSWRGAPIRTTTRPCRTSGQRVLRSAPQASSSSQRA